MYEQIIKYIKSEADPKYKEFHYKLTNDNTIIGTRTPTLKKIAKYLAKNNYNEFLKNSKYETYEEKVLETTETSEEKIFTIIEAKNCFYDAGFVEFVAGAKKAAEYTFTAENSSDAEWCVYLLDEAFDDSFRYIKQVAEPALAGNGTIYVAEGQYVYVYCSANEFTTGTVDEYAKLNVTMK